MAKRKNVNNLASSVRPFSSQAFPLEKIFKARERERGGWLDDDAIVRFIDTACRELQSAIERDDRERLGEECADFWGYLAKRYGDNEELLGLIGEKWPDDPEVLQLATEYIDRLYALSETQLRCATTLVDYVLGLLKEGKVVKVVEHLSSDENDVPYDEVVFLPPESDEDPEYIVNTLYDFYKELNFYGGQLDILICVDEDKKVIMHSFVFTESAVFRVPKDVIAQTIAEDISRMQDPGELSFCVSVDGEPFELEYQEAPFSFLS